MSTLSAIVLSPHGYTGLAYYLYSLCEGLTGQGVDVSLWTSDRWILEGRTSGFTRRTVYRGCSGNVPRLVKGLRYVMAAGAIARALPRSGPDVVHMQIVELPLIELMLMRRFKRYGVPVVFTPHDLVHNKRFVFNEGVYRQLYHSADRVIVHNLANRESLHQRFGVPLERVAVIPHGGYEYFVSDPPSRHAARRMLELPEQGPLILFFGDIRPGKGLPRLLDALAALPAPRPRLVIAGRTSHGLTSEWVDGQVARAGVEDVVIRRLGFVPDAHVTAYYRAADVVALPYETISESGVLRYAQTCGRAAVCSDLPELRDSFSDGATGWLARPGDTASLERALGAALADTGRDEVGARGKAWLESYASWKGIAQSTAAVYDEVTHA